MTELEKDIILKGIKAIKQSHAHAITKLESLVSDGFSVETYEIDYSYADALKNEILECIDKSAYIIDGVGNSLLKTHILKFFTDLENKDKKSNDS